MKKKSAKKEKLIDLLHAALQKQAGFQVVRDGWDETSKGRLEDHAEWLEINIPTEDENKRMCVHFYFDQNSTRLDDVIIYKQRKKKGYKPHKTFAARYFDEKKKENEKNKFDESVKKAADAIVAKKTFNGGTVTIPC